MIITDSMIDAIKQAIRDDSFHSKTSEFFKQEDKFFQCLSPQQEGIVDGFIRALYYIEEKGLKGQKILKQ